MVGFLPDIVKAGIKKEVKKTGRQHTVYSHGCIMHGGFFQVQYLVNTLKYAAPDAATHLLAHLALTDYKCPRANLESSSSSQMAANCIHS